MCKNHGVDGEQLVDMLFEYVISTFGEAKPPTLEDLRDFEAKQLLRPVKKEIDSTSPVIDLDAANDTDILDIYRKTPKVEPPDVSFCQNVIYFNLMNVYSFIRKNLYRVISISTGFHFNS